MKASSDTLERVESDIISCEKCPRLRVYCKKIAVTKKREFQNDTYWGKPVPSFGDPKAKLFILGLAPAAHGANRTGRMFTGDNSGLWLYRALYRGGFSNQEKSTSSNDALKLKGAFISATNHCAPPDNKPLPEEILNCRPYLERELELFKAAKVYLVLGQIALTNLWKTLPLEVKATKGIPKFGHGIEIPLLNDKTILCSFHPSQQNTFTKRLTEPMLDAIFTRARELI